MVETRRLIESHGLGQTDRSLPTSRYSIGAIRPRASIHLTCFLGQSSTTTVIAKQKEDALIRLARTTHEHA
jgi:hypothetical protein